MDIRWNLDKILPIKDFDKSISLFERKIQLFTSIYSTSSTEIKISEFKSLLNLYIELTIDIYKIYTRAMLAEETNNNDESIKYIKTKANNIYVIFQNNTRSFINWIKGKETVNKNILSDKNSVKYFVKYPKLDYYFKRLRDLSKHTLDNTSEEIITHKDITGIQTLLELKSLIETEQRYRTTINGKKRTFHNSSELSVYFKDKNKQNRVNSYNVLYKQYSKNINKYLTIYQSIIKDWNYEKNLRGFKTNIAVRNFANDINDASVTRLLDSCVKNKNIFIDFFELKRKEMGYKKFSRYDLYASLGKVDKNYKYKEAINIILNAYKGFDSEFYNIAKSFLESNHLDVFPNKHKRSGAFCANISPGINPYILLNYTNTIRDVSILAHELGHAIHFILSQQQTILTQDAPLTLAETASIFSENLVFDYLFKQEKDKEIKKLMLFDKISDTYGTVTRQAYFVLFEIEAHEALNKGIKLSDFNNLYLNNLKSQFGKNIDIPELFKYEWSYIPHLVNSPFYCYAYPFGQLLSLALYQEYEKKGSEFLPKFKRILSSGGSKQPLKLLKDEGFDIGKSDFFDEGFKIVENWVMQLKELL